MITCAGKPVTAGGLLKIYLAAARIFPRRVHFPAEPALPVNYVRAQFFLRGTTLTDWARSRGYTLSTVHYAITGELRGRKSMEIIEALRKELKQ